MRLPHLHTLISVAPPISLHFSSTCTPSSPHMALASARIKNRTSTSTRPLVTTAAFLSRTVRMILGMRAHLSTKTPALHWLVAIISGSTATRACRPLWPRSNSRNRICTTMAPCSARTRTSRPALRTRNPRRRTRKNHSPHLLATTTTTHRRLATGTISRGQDTFNHILVSRQNPLCHAHNTGLIALFSIPQLNLNSRPRRPLDERKEEKI